MAAAGARESTAEQANDLRAAVLGCNDRQLAFGGAAALAIYGIGRLFGGLVM